MTITAQTSKTGPYSGNGTTTVFSYTFEVQDEAHLVVDVLASDGITVTRPVLNVGYTVTGVGNPAGGTVVMASAPGVGEKLTITRAVPIDQEIDLENRRSVAPEVLEDGFDKLTQIAQDHQEQLDRTIKVDLFETADLDQLVLNINAVAAIEADVSAVAAIDGDVSLVAAIDDKVVIAADNVADITNFADVYLGPAAADPATRTDGSALQAGDLYFNTVSDQMLSYSGSAWVNYEADAVAAKVAAELAETNAETAEAGAVAARVAAEAAQTGAELAETNAETARDAAFVNANVYADTAAGLAATTTGDQFQVVNGDEVIRYRHDAGPVATEIARYPGAAAVLSYLENRVVTEPGLLGAITGTDSDGFFRTLAAFYEDGSLQSKPVTDLITTTVGGSEYSTGTLVGWGGVVFYQEDSGGTPYIVAGLRASGEWFPGGDAGEPKVLYHIPFHGQSNAMADESRPVISVTASGWGNFRFARGVATWSSVDNPETPASRADNGFTLVPLTAGAVETRANALADHFKARVTGASRYTAADTLEGPYVLMSSASLGGRKLTELGPEDDGASGDPGVRSPGGFWPTLLDDVLRAKNAAAARGLSYQLPFWNYDQGESEGDLKLYFTGSVLLPSQVISGYATKALTMVGDFNTAVQSITGKTRPTPCLITPACYNLLTPTAWLDVCNQSTLAIMVGPRYQMPTALMSDPRGDNIHYSPDGHRWIGEMVAKVGARVMDGEEWKPLQALYAEKSGANTVDVIFNVPRPPMVLDTRTWPKVRGWGFRVYSGSVDSKANLAYPTAIEVLPDGASVRLTFASTVPVGAKLSIGGESICADLTGLSVTTVGSTTLNGQPAYTLTIAGDYTTLFNRALNDGAFYVYANRPSQGVIRAVSLVSGDTVLTGEDSELRTGGSYGPFQNGDVIDTGVLLPRTNLRDSDSAASINTFVSGGRAGQPYPLQNWLCQYDGLTVEGA